MTTPATPTSAPLSFDANAIRALLPHRWPMLLVDRAYDVIPGKSGYGIKNVTISEPYFAGHYPDQSIMPGVLIVEAMAQLTAVVYASAWLAEAGQSGEAEVAARVGYLGAIRQMKFSRLVVPGDRLTMKVELGRPFDRLTPVTVQASVDGELAAKGSLTVSERTAGDPSGLQ
ncbi:3-hydroxyacyl-ACP dehydratase FabZ [Streptomyces mobaraensis]|uniref:3-hydroxyacyl-[acyl-carrier-protein] dehydratase n=2 Tax=Streptomyces mobaraensis TaxID=35621 RepID=A0A5N5W6V1_STRMB|nr:3-hydroxyacyl-ACP dehydratase FabZ [Streptomyces mobaraensis]EMF01989.1 beta-hydroxyacyl-ACP dehydratase [Streptomyces mobaraensis NBRC 13819 = DSM 40847]KAB7843737.1 3-hydroxyacyl-ACP dehydratase FabZ [Streptomyces mobaraensis]